MEGDYHFVDDKSIPPVVNLPRKFPIALKVHLKRAYTMGGKLSYGC